MHTLFKVLIRLDKGVESMSTGREVNAPATLYLAGAVIDESSAGNFFLVFTKNQKALRRCCLQLITIRSSFIYKTVPIELKPSFFKRYVGG